MADLILLDVREGDTEDDVVEALLAEILKKYEFDESKVNRHPAGTSEGGQFAPKDGVSEQSQNSDVAERSQLIEELETVGREWLKDKVGNGEPSRQDLADLMRHLGTEHSERINALIKDFDDYSKYPERPAIHLTVGRKGVPDVWLLGWRENEKGLEATPIHDHGPSEVGVYVHKGRVNERIFAIDKSEIGQQEIEFREVDRGLDSGSAITINAPYLHDIGAQRGAGTSVTLHAYYPPLNDMNFYEVKGSKLVKSGNWKENPDVMKTKGFERSHVFPCFHYSTKKYHDPNVAERIVEYHTPGGHDHDQSTHGNWATGTSGTSEGGQRQLPGIPRGDEARTERKLTEQKLASSPITEEKALGGGMMETLMLTLEDGTKAVFKPADGEEGQFDGIPRGQYYLREVATSDLAEILGMTDVVGKAVVREVDGRIGSVAEYMNDTLDVAAAFDDPLEGVDPATAGKVAAFDYVIANHDRHEKNWVTNGAGEFALIDHGLVLPAHESRFPWSGFASKASDENVTLEDAIGDSWDDKWEPIEKKLVERGFTNSVIEGARYRFDRLIDEKNAGSAFSDL